MQWIIHHYTTALYIYNTILIYIIIDYSIQWAAQERAFGARTGAIGLHQGEWTRG
jgi:hypothetical protein